MVFFCCFPIGLLTRCCCRDEERAPLYAPEVEQPSSSSQSRQGHPSAGPQGQPMNLLALKDKEIKYLKIVIAKKDNELSDLTERATYADVRIRELEKETDELKDRLSSAFSAQLTDNNPDVADLSDANRPTKLAEQFSELYDNTWTDLFDQLSATKALDETETVQKILELFQMIYDVCQKTAAKELEDMKSALDGFTGGNNLETLKQLKEHRKKNFVDKIKQIRNNDVLVEEIQQMVNEKFNGCDSVEGFVSECFQICWLMAIQDPPMCVLEWRNVQGQPFNQETYRSFTRTGSEIDYVVWPTLLLNDGGNVAFKGVAQPM